MKVKTNHTHYSRKIVILYFATALAIGIAVAILLFFALRPVVKESAQAAMVQNTCVQQDGMRLCAEIPDVLPMTADAKDPNVIRTDQTVKSTLTNISNKPKTFTHNSTCTTPIPRLNGTQAQAVCGAAVIKDTFAAGETKQYTLQLDRMFVGQNVIHSGDNELALGWRDILLQKPVTLQ